MCLLSITRALSLLQQCWLTLPPCWWVGGRTSLPLSLTFPAASMVSGVLPAQLPTRPANTMGKNREAARRLLNQPHLLGSAPLVPVGVDRTRVLTNLLWCQVRAQVPWAHWHHSGKGCYRVLPLPKSLLLNPLRTPHPPPWQWGELELHTLLLLGGDKESAPTYPVTLCGGQLVTTCFPWGDSWVLREVVVPIGVWPEQLL